MNIRVDWPARGHGYTEEEIQAVAEVMRASGDALTNGPHVRRFEEAFVEQGMTQRPARRSLVGKRKTARRRAVFDRNERIE